MRSPSDEMSSNKLLKTLRGQDLAMLALFNSKERTSEQWAGLIKRADQRFVMESVTPMPPGPLALIVLVWK